ncbi:hypothetical protein ACRB68_74200 [Actinomadura sp. RB68]|uniref:Uncharacterized protein n=1 Tax=Actinomadura macrotermitis TaxID=2585200 RepID=A0A7K0C760_9ACTN|nr:hypothetical protein [Actinomadura macrotermitis]
MAGPEDADARPTPDPFPNPADQDRCFLSIDGFTAKSIDVTYHGLPGNRPKAYGNTLAVWENTVIPWGVKPQRRVRVSSNAESGLETITDLQVTRSAYTVAYCTGRELTDAAACATLAAGADFSPPTSVSVTADQVGERSLSVSYRTLYGYRPRTYRNWIGLWPGLVSPYNAPEPQARAVPSDASEGRLVMDDIELAADTVYTLIYFMDADATTAAAFHTFRTAG